MGKKQQKAIMKEHVWELGCLWLVARVLVARLVRHPLCRLFGAKRTGAVQRMLSTDWTRKLLTGATMAEEVVPLRHGGKKSGQVILAGSYGLLCYVGWFDSEQPPLARV